MDGSEIRRLLQIAITAAFEGGNEIMAVYDSAFSVELKDDDSPLTLADKNAHLAIVEHLEATGLPILSEEGSDIPFEERENWEHFWMVDPLDGTKEFIKKNGEFTVNIALVHNGNPVAGVIYVPVKDWLYFGIEGMGAFKNTNPQPKSTKLININELVTRSAQLPQIDPRIKFTVVASRSHMSKETEAYIDELRKEHGEVEITSMGSSLKICLVAEGKAHVYPRFAPTMEWDTAAGHAIAAAADKQVVNYNTKEPLQYNKEDLHNDWFIVE